MISVIIPAYEVIPVKLKRCLDSIISKTNVPYEIIIVDDGSTKNTVMNSLELDYVTKNNLIVIEAEHRGVSHARNLGVKRASGEYCCFVDADDEITPEALNRAQKLIDETNADIICGYLQFIRRETDRFCYSNYTNKDFFFINPDELYNYHLSGKIRKEIYNGPYNSILKNGPVARVVKTEIAQRVSFPESVSISEDTLWNIAIFNQVQTSVVANDIWYWYWKGIESASSGYDYRAVEKCEECLIELDKLIRTMERETPKELVASRIMGEINRVVKRYLKYNNCPLNNKDKKKIIRDLLNNDCNRDYLNADSIMRSGSDGIAKYILQKTGLIIYFWKLLER